MSSVPVTLVGVPGIGKSRLVGELFNAIESDGFVVVLARGPLLPYGEGVSLWALGEIVKAQAGILESDGREDARREASPTAERDRGPPTTPSGCRGTCSRSSASSESPAVTGAPRRSRPGAASSRRSPNSGPSILVLEDVHWADDTLSTSSSTSSNGRRALHYFALTTRPSCSTAAAGARRSRVW